MSAGFNIEDVCRLLGISILRRNGGSFSVVCPFCGDKRGKMNMCISKGNQLKNTYHCFNSGCGAKGNMLTLYADMMNLSGSDRYKQAYHEIRESLHLSPDHKRTASVIRYSKGDYREAEKASPAVCDQTYRMMMSYLQLSDVHKKRLLERGFTEEQILQIGFRSTPAYGTAGICRQLIESGCVLDGVPGFYLNENGDYDVCFSLKNSGFLCPVAGLDGRLDGFQIRLDKPYEGRKYIWLSSSGKKRGTSSGSPVAFYGNPCDETIYVTEGALKGGLAHSFSGYSFACVAGVGQYRNLRKMLITCKTYGCRKVVEAYDMDKFMPVICSRNEGKKCHECNSSHGFCEIKKRKRDAIRKGCNHLYEICRELNLSVVRKTWDQTEEGLWCGNYKGIDDYWYAMRQERKMAG